MKKIATLLCLLLSFQLLFAQNIKIDKLLYGVAYYDEYMPYDRLDKDVQMMKEAGMNVGVDFVDPSGINIEDYKLLIVPVLYAAPDSLLQRLNRYVQNGGHIVYTFKSGFSDQNVQVRTARQPGIISEACGIYYSQFTIPQNVTLKGNPYGVGKDNNTVITWMELITPTTAKVLAYYNHPVWGNYAAITENNYGKGLATYIGCATSNAVTKKILQDAVKKANLWGAAQQLNFPIITKSGMNEMGKTIHYVFNYSAQAVTIIYPFGNGRELLGGKVIGKNSNMVLAPWGVGIVEEE